MANYRPLISWTNVNNTVETYYYDADQITSPSTQLAIGVNDLKTTGTSVGLRICSAVPVNNTFIYRTIDSGLTQYTGLTSYNNSALQSFYPNYTFQTNPIYYYQTTSSAPNKDAILSIGDGSVPEYHTAIEALQNFSTDIAYVSLYGGNQQIPFILEFAPEALRPSIDWKLYRYNRTGNVFTMYKWDCTLNWTPKMLSFAQELITWGDVHIALLEKLAITDPYTVRNEWTINFTPNEFPISKDILFNNTLGFRALTFWVDYQINTDLQTDRFRVDMDRSGANVNLWDITRIDSNDNSTCVVIDSAPEDDEDYEVITPSSDPTDTPSDIESDSDIISAVSVGNTVYSLTINDYSSLISYLWTSTFIDDIKLINNNPIENIISAKLFPFGFDVGTNTAVVLGNVNTGIAALKIARSYSGFYLHLVNAYQVESFYDNFLDLSPYTSITIYLPYIGLKELDSSMVNGKTLDVWYSFDLIMGIVVATIYVDNTVMYMFQGQIAIDLPVTSSNRAQVESTYVTNAATSLIAGVAAAASVAGGVIGTMGVGAVAGVGLGTALIGSTVSNAKVQNHTQTAGSFSPNAYGALSKQIVITYDRPTYQDIATFNHVTGRACSLSAYLYSMRGFTVVSPTVDLSSIPCTEEERELIRDYLSNGIIL